jgi:hypothetical protein
VSNDNPKLLLWMAIAEGTLEEVRRAGVTLERSAS